MAIHVMAVPESATVRSINQFHRDLLAAIEVHDEVVLDLAPVSEMDLSLIQAIEAARLRSCQEGGTLRLLQPAAAGTAALLARAGFLTDPEPADIDFWFHGSAPQ